MGGFDGSHDVPAIPGMAAPAGVNLGSAIVLPPGAQVFYVRGSAGTVTSYDYDPPGLQDRLHPTVARALASCTATRGDVIVGLPGHTESIASASAWPLVAGVRIMGFGNGNNRPTFTWTTATSTVLMNKANVSIEGCILNLDAGAGTVTVAAPITISANGNAIKNCKIRMGTSSTAIVTIGITSAACTDLEIIGNEAYGATTAECTTMFQFVGADRLKFHGNSVVGATSAAAVGVVRFLTTASTDIKMYRNSVRNNKALSSQAITGMTALSGECDHLHMTVLSDATAALTAAFSTAASMTFGRHVYVTNVVAERAALYGTESA